MRLLKDSQFSGRIFFKFAKLEYNFVSNSCHLCFDVGEDYTFSIALPPIAMYLSFGYGKYKDKEIGLYIHNWAIWWCFWTSTMEWSSKTPKWRKGCWYFLDTILGKSKYSRTIIEERDIEIPMPEGNYNAHIKLCKDTWKRPRGFAKTIRRIDSNIPNGIPHQGKGENSWDCGEDGCFGMCCPANSIADGVGKIVGSVLHYRIKYGGWDDWNYKRKGMRKGAR